MRAETKQLILNPPPYPLRVNKELPNGLIKGEWE